MKGASGWPTAPRATLSDLKATAGDEFAFSAEVSGTTAVVGAEAGPLGGGHLHLAELLLERTQLGVQAGELHLVLRGGGAARGHGERVDVILDCQSGLGRHFWSSGIRCCRSTNRTIWDAKSSRQTPSGLWFTAE